LTDAERFACRTLTLVRRSRRAFRVAHWRGDEGEFILLHLESLVFFNVYRQKKSDGAFRDAVQMELVQIDPRAPWVFAGDWNQQPEESDVVESLAFTGALPLQARGPGGEPMGGQALH